MACFLYMILVVRLFYWAEELALTACKKLPWVENLGRGYDGAQGNPHENPDPGFRVQVVKLKYNEGETTADGK